MTIVNFPEQEKTEIVGPKISGNSVIVDGRIIPNLSIVETDEGYFLSLDRRFGIDLTEENVRPVAWMLANALAVGAGYSHCGAETKDKPFAPMLGRIGGDE